jgi:hypothetical protein
VAGGHQGMKPGGHGSHQSWEVERTECLGKGGRPCAPTPFPKKAMLAERGVENI